MTGAALGPAVWFDVISDTVCGGPPGSAGFLLFLADLLREQGGDAADGGCAHQREHNP